MLDSKPILLVEDDCVDVMAVQRALKELHVANGLAYAGDGEEALAYLRSLENEAPCMILLDLNMPKMGGLEFLKVKSADEVLKDIPVVVVTTSDEQEDRATSFELGAAAYILKGNDYGEFRENKRVIEPYLTPVRPPERLAMALS